MLSFKLLGPLARSRTASLTRGRICTYKPSLPSVHPCIYIGLCPPIRQGIGPLYGNMDEFRTEGSGYINAILLVAVWVRYKHIVCLWSIQRQVAGTRVLAQMMDIHVRRLLRL
jgi:hypothetical protein